MNASSNDLRSLLNWNNAMVDIGMADDVSMTFAVHSTPHRLLSEWMTFV